MNYRLDGIDEPGVRKVLELGGCVADDHDDHVVGIEVLSCHGLDVLEGHVGHDFLLLGDEVVSKIVDSDA